MRLAIISTVSLVMLCGILVGQPRAHAQDAGETHPVFRKLPDTEIGSFPGRETLLDFNDVPRFFHAYTEHSKSAPPADFPAATQIVWLWSQIDGSRPLIDIRNGKIVLSLPGMDGDAPPSAGHKSETAADAQPTFVLEETSGDPDDPANQSLQNHRSEIFFMDEYRIDIVNKKDFVGLFDQKPASASASKSLATNAWAMRKEFALPAGHVADAKAYSIYAFFRPLSYHSSTVWHHPFTASRGTAITSYHIAVELLRLEVVENATDKPVAILEPQKGK